MPQTDGRTSYRSITALCRLSFIHFISQNTSYIKTMKINVLKVFHRTERPVALTTAHTNKIQSNANTKQMNNTNNEYC